MKTLRTFCVFVGLFTFVSAKNIVENSEIIIDISQRLRAIEATLEQSLKKNEQLEQRVATLEFENSELKATVEKLKNQVQETDTCGTDGIEQRVVALEMENSELKATVENLQHQVQETGPCETDRVETMELDNSFNKIQDNKVSTLQPSQSKSKRQGISKPVAFTAVVSSDLSNLGAGQTIIYDQVITNVGGAYHSTTGVFTAPYTGIYVFNFALMIDPGKYEYIALVKNGQAVIFNYGHAIGSSHIVSSSRTGTIELRAGDEVWVKTYQVSWHGSGQIHGSYTNFCGWIIYHDE